MRKIVLRIILNSLLGALLVFVWSRFVNLEEVVRMLKTTRLDYVLFFFIFFITSTILRATRLKLLLSQFKPALKDILMINYLSQFLSFLVPIRAGEMTKSVYLSTQFNLPLAKALIWVFIDRFLDLWIVLLLLSSLLVILPTNLPSSLGQTAALILLVFTLLAIFSIKSEKFLKNLTTNVSKILIHPKLQSLFISLSHNIIEGFAILHRCPRDLAVLFTLTLVPAVLDGIIWVFIFASFNQGIAVLRGVLGNSLFALTFLIPAAPGYVGSAEAAGLAVFGGVLGVGVNLASAATVLFHILTMVILLILGISSLYLLKFDLGLVWKKIRGGS